MAKPNIEQRKRAGAKRQRVKQKINALKIENIDEISSDFVDLEKMQQNILKNGLVTPLEFMIAVYMDDDVEMRLRLDAARSASKFIHKSQPVMIEQTTTSGNGIKIVAVRAAARASLIEFLDTEDAVEIIDDDTGDSHLVINGEVEVV